MKKNSMLAKNFFILAIGSISMVSALFVPFQNQTPVNQNSDLTRSDEWDYGEDDYRNHINTEWSCEDPNNCTDEEEATILPTYSMPTELWQEDYQHTGKPAWVTPKAETNANVSTRRRFFYHYLNSIGLSQSATEYFEPYIDWSQDGSKWFVDDTRLDEIVVEFTFPTSNPFKIPWTYEGNEWFNDIDDSYGLSFEIDGVIYDKTSDLYVPYERTYMFEDVSKYGTADKQWKLNIVEDRNNPNQKITTNSIEGWEWEQSSKGWNTSYQIITESVNDVIQPLISNKTSTGSNIYNIYSHPDGGEMWDIGWWGFIMTNGLSPKASPDPTQGLFNTLAKLPLRYISIPLTDKPSKPGVGNSQNITFQAGMPEVFYDIEHPIEPITKEQNKSLQDEIDKGLKPTTFTSKFLAWPKSYGEKTYQDFSNTARELDFPKQEVIPFDDIVVSDADKAIGIFLITWSLIMFVGAITFFIATRLKHRAIVGYYDKKSGKGKN